MDISKNNNKNYNQQHELNHKHLFIMLQDLELLICSLKVSFLQIKGLNTKDLTVNTKNNTAMI